MLCDFGFKTFLPDPSSTFSLSGVCAVHPVWTVPAPLYGCCGYVAYWCARRCHRHHRCLPRAQILQSLLEGVQLQLSGSLPPGVQLVASLPPGWQLAADGGAVPGSADGRLLGQTVQLVDPFTLHHLQQQQQQQNNPHLAVTPQVMSHHVATSTVVDAHLTTQVGDAYISACPRGHDVCRCSPSALSGNLHPSFSMAISARLFSWPFSPLRFHGHFHPSVFMAISTPLFSWQFPPLCFRGNFHPSVFVAISTPLFS